MIQRDEPSDLELLQRWQAGDRECGSRLFNRHFDAVHRFFAAKVEAQVVADLVGETMLSCVESARRFRGEGTFRAYLFGVARYVLLSHYKTKRRHGDRSFDASVTSLLALSPSPTKLRWRRQELSLLHEALCRLPLDLQLVVEMHYWEGMSTADLAVMFDVPRGTIKSRLRRAREQLEARVEEIGKSGPVVASTTADLERWARDLRDELDAG